jgi:hypothetical protein
MKRPKYVYPSRISQTLFCSVCSDVFLAPKRLACGHVLCAECLKAWLESGNKCPFDRTPIDKKNIQEETLVNEILDDMEIYCENKANGCSYTNIRKTMSIHEEICKRKNVPLCLRGEREKTCENADELLNEKLENENTNMGLLMKIYQKDNSIVESLIKRGNDVSGREGHKH